MAIIISIYMIVNEMLKVMLITVDNFIGYLMAKESEKEMTQRRVYVLPTELAERIVAFQRERGLSSEVEAVRLLLDEALLNYDTRESLLAKLRNRINKTKQTKEAVKDILFGHPLILGIDFSGRDIMASFTDGYKVQVKERGAILSSTGRDIDDEVPF